MTKLGDDMTINTPARKEGNMIDRRKATEHKPLNFQICTFTKITIEQYLSLKLSSIMSKYYDTFSYED